MKGLGTLSLQDGLLRHYFSICGNIMYRRFIPGAVLLALAACDPGAQHTATIHAVDKPDYAAALSHPDRRSADAARDQSRKPAEVLAFFGIETGMTRILRL